MIFVTIKLFRLFKKFTINLIYLRVLDILHLGDAANDTNVTDTCVGFETDEGKYFTHLHSSYHLTPVTKVVSRLFQFLLRLDEIPSITVSEVDVEFTVRSFNGTQFYPFAHPSFLRKIGMKLFTGVQIPPV